MTLTLFSNCCLGQRASHLGKEVVRDCNPFNMNSTHPDFILHHATHPKQQPTAITTGIATRAVLAALRPLAALEAGLNVGGAMVVVEERATLGLRGVPDPKR